ncbi:hypothetical protein SK128_024299 [Halocaridina rubra]|uniref:Uncharacterized protein n=1 Tax=Halocaridina rubra TaxID=373956 RepID=A0AAN9ABR7_HALRR
MRTPTTTESSLEGEVEGVEEVILLEEEEEEVEDDPPTEDFPPRFKPALEVPLLLFINGIYK